MVHKNLNAQHEECVSAVDVTLTAVLTFTSEASGPSLDVWFESVLFTVLALAQYRLLAQL